MGITTEMTESLGIKVELLRVRCQPALMEGEEPRDRSGSLGERNEKPQIFLDQRADILGKRMLHPATGWAE